MKLLLDTSAFLWWITDSDLLSRRAREVIGDGENETWFSAVSGWEIVIKAGLGRVALPEEPAHFIPRQLSLNAFQILPIHLRHALRVSSLPAIHRDPFDRLLVAQALVEELTIITSDSHIVSYPVSCLW